MSSVRRADSAFWAMVALVAATITTKRISSRYCFILFFPPKRVWSFALRFAPPEGETPNLKAELLTWRRDSKLQTPYLWGLKSGWIVQLLRRRICAWPVYKRRKSAIRGPTLRRRFWRHPEWFA